MARCPFAEWHPLGPQTEPRLTKKYGIAGHTMVGSLLGTDSYFRTGNGAGYIGTESHFGIGQGRLFQWQDTDWQADAQLEGNDNIISIETADIGAGYPPWTGSDVPAMAPADYELWIRLCVWLCDTHGIPPVQMDDATEHPRMGIGWHRLGIEPWRVPGTELWSSSYGKVCPGDRKIAQFTASIPVIKARLEDDMPTIEEIDALLTKKRGEYPSGNPIAISSPAAHLYSWEARNKASEIQIALAAQQALIEQLVAAHGPDDLTAERVRAEVDAALAAARTLDAQAVVDLLTPVIEALPDTVDKQTVKTALAEVLTEGVGA